MRVGLLSKIFQKSPRMAVAGAAGSTVTALGIALALLIQPWESRRYVPYYDSGNVLTVCDGITGKDVIKNKVYTDAECDALGAKHAKAHADSVKRLVTYKPLPIYVEAAFISFHYNVGEGNFRKSTLLKLANKGDLMGACNQLSKWVFVNGVKIRGLENRRFLGDAERVSERTVCMIGLDDKYRTPLFEKLIMKVKF